MYYWKENIFRQNEIPHLLKILLSLPFSYLPWNHFSDEHEWFLKSVAREEPYTDYYVWKDPAGYDENGNPLPPNNWVNCSVYVCRQSKGIRKTKTFWFVWLRGVSSVPFPFRSPFQLHCKQVSSGISSQSVQNILIWHVT